MARRHDSDHSCDGVEDALCRLPLIYGTTQRSSLPLLGYAQLGVEFFLAFVQRLQA